MLDKYILLTDKHCYFVEYLIGELVLSNSLSDAMIFDNLKTAHKFKKMLASTCDLDCSVNTFITG